MNFFCSRLLCCWGMYCPCVLTYPCKVMWWCYRMGSFLVMLNDYISYIQLMTVHCGLNIAQGIILHVLNQTPSPNVFHYWIPQNAVVICTNNCAHPCEEHLPSNCDLCPIELSEAKVKPFIRCSDMDETFSLNWLCEMSWVTEGDWQGCYHPPCKGSGRSTL